MRTYTLARTGSAVLFTAVAVLAACTVDSTGSPEGTTELAAQAQAGGPRPAHVMLKRLPGAPEIVPDATCTLKYYGGPVLQNPKITMVNWGANIESQVQTTMPSFYAALVGSSYWDWLSEYNTVGLTTGFQQGLSRGTFAGSKTITPSMGDCPGTGCNIADSDIQTELAAQITAGNLPAPTKGCDGQNDTLYMVHFPPQIVITDPSGNPSCDPSQGTTGNAFCGYHGTAMIASGTLAYGVIPSMVTGPCATPPGCGGSSTAIDNETAVVSHEVAEAATDTNVGLATVVGAPLGWYANASGCAEIGDICNAQQGTITVSGTTWTVQTLWSNAKKACILAKSALPPICSTAGQTGCRKCACSDANEGAAGQVGCSTSTPWCETDTTNIKAGECVQCTTTPECASGDTCTKSTSVSTDDTCTGGTVVDAGGGTDAGETDAGETDGGGGKDAGPEDAGSTKDAGGKDAGEADAGGGKDAGTGGKDGGTGTDAGATDAGGGADTGTGDDSGATGDDSGAVSDDAGTVGDDAGTTATFEAGIPLDAGILAALDAAVDDDGAAEDGGNSASGNSGGCGCKVAGARGAGGGGTPPALLGLGALAAAFRLRRRRRA